MTRVAELIDLIVQGKNAEASDVLNQELLSRSHQAVNDFKPQVAAEYFSSVVDMPTEEQPDDEQQISQEESQDEAD